MLRFTVFKAQCTPVLRGAVLNQLNAIGKYYIGKERLQKKNMTNDCK